MASVLAERHRLAQLRLGVRVVGLLHAAFRLLNPADLDGTFDDWLAVVEPLVTNSRRVSAQMAAAYLSAARVNAIGFDPAYVPAIAADLSPQALRTSMLVTGPASIKAAIGRRSVTDDLDRVVRRALDVAESRSSAAGMRYALNGGRETILENVRRDDRARGWTRVASGKCCAFCSQLEGRGAVYSEASAAFQAHDGCSCSAEPVFA